MSSEVWTADMRAGLHLGGGGLGGGGGGLGGGGLGGGLTRNKTRKTHLSTDVKDPI